MAQVERKWIQDQAISNEKVDPTDIYTITGLRVDETNAIGRVGIGLSSPLDALHIQRTDSSSGMMLDLSDGTNGKLYKIYSGANGLLNFTDATDGGIFTYGESGSIGRVGINTASIQDHLHVSSPLTDAALRLDLDDGLNGRAYRLVSDTDGAFRIIDVDAGNVNRLQIANTGTLTVSGDATFDSNFQINGTVTVINTEIVIADQLEINQTDNQAALIVSQDTGGATATVMRIENAGTGHALTVDSGNVGIGTLTPAAPLHVQGDIITANGYNIGDTTHRIGTLWMASTVDYLTDLNFSSGGTNVTFATGGNVGIGSGTPTQALDVVGTIENTGDIITTGSYPSGLIRGAYLTITTGNSTFQGRVGIGVTSPSYPLHVGGDIYSNTGNIVATAGTVTGGSGLIATTGGVIASAGNITATLGDLIASAGSVTANTNVTATNGNIVASNGNISATNGTVTGGTGLIATTGGVTALAGNISASAGSVTANTNITATNGNIVASNGNISATNGTVTGGTGLIATTGGVTATAGNITASNGSFVAPNGIVSVGFGVIAAGGDIFAQTGKVGISTSSIAGGYVLHVQGNAYCSGQVDTNTLDVGSGSFTVSAIGATNIGPGWLTFGQHMSGGGQIGSASTVNIVSTSGATMSGGSGAVSITTNNSGTPSAINVTSGNNTGSGVGGALNLNAGDSGGAGTGGAVTITGGTASGGGSTGGDILLLPGSAVSNGRVEVGTGASSKNLWVSGSVTIEGANSAFALSINNTNYVGAYCAIAGASTVAGWFENSGSDSTSMFVQQLNTGKGLFATGLGLNSFAGFFQSTGYTTLRSEVSGTGGGDYAVHAICTNAGSSATSAAVFAQNWGGGKAIQATAGTGTTIQGSNTNGTAIYGSQAGTSGRAGRFRCNAGSYAYNAVEVEVTSGTGASKGILVNYTGSGNAIEVNGGSGYGIEAYQSAGTVYHGTNSGTTGRAALFETSNTSFNGTIVEISSNTTSLNNNCLVCNHSGSGTGLTVNSNAAGASFGINSFMPGVSGTGRAINGYCVSASGFAGYFTGNVHIAGTLSKTAGGFKIDHPIEPETKNLVHSFVESPEMRNVYYGRAVTHDGTASIGLPDWWVTLNGSNKEEYNYSLTTIGKYSRLFISKEIENNQFEVSSLDGDCTFSWTISAIRHDTYAESNRIQVEKNKTQEEIDDYKKEHGISV